MTVVRQAEPWFGVTRTVMQELAETARFDSLESVQGTIIYTIALDAFDKPSADGTSTVLAIEQEIALAKRLAMSARRDDLDAFIILFTRAKEFEDKLHQGATLPAHLDCAAGIGASPQERRKALMEKITDDVDACAGRRTTYAYSVDVQDEAKTQKVFTTISRLLFVLGELTLAGLL